MPKQSREQIIAELDARKVGYSEDMSYNELLEVLKQAQAKDPETASPAPVAPPPVEAPIDYAGIYCGLSTIQSLHRRVTLLERAVERLTHA